jgi:hypothetical protein
MKRMMFVGALLVAGLAAGCSSTQTCDSDAQKCDSSKQCDISKCDKDASNCDKSACTKKADCASESDCKDGASKCGDCKDGAMCEKCAAHAGAKLPCPECKPGQPCCAKCAAKMTEHTQVCADCKDGAKCAKCAA